MLTGMLRDDVREFFSKTHLGIRKLITQQNERILKKKGKEAKASTPPPWPKAHIHSSH